MKYSTIGYILGQVLKFEGIFMLLPFLTGMIYHENEAYSYLIIGIICFVLGCLITLKKVKHPQIFNRCCRCLKLDRFKYFRCHSVCDHW